MNENRLELLSKFSEGLFAEASGSSYALWDFLTRAGAPILGCHAASFFEADDVKKILTFKTSIGPVGADLLGVSFAYQGVAGECARKRLAVLANDAENDPRFTKKVDQSTGFKTKCALAVPALAGGTLLGVMEFINSASGAFSNDDFLLAQAITTLTSREVYIKKLEATIKQLNLRGESTINNLSGGFIGADIQGQIIFFNPKAKEVFETGEEYLGRNIITLSQLCPDLVSSIDAVLKQNKTVRRQEFQCFVNGKIKVIGYSSINIKGVDGAVIGAGVIFQDITNL
ncbi:MAG: GAF domain-containing protein [Elusimicrobia bacterium]|nr:GAF domain-containing protein [Elusimicrobiota bacterium]